MKFFSAVPVSAAATMWYFFLLDATFSMNLKMPTVVFPAAVVYVPSSTSKGALHRRNALYLSDKIRLSVLKGESPPCLLAVFIMIYYFCLRLAVEANCQAWTTLPLCRILPPYPETYPNVCLSALLLSTSQS